MLRSWPARTAAPAGRQTLTPEAPAMAARRLVLLALGATLVVTCCCGCAAKREPAQQTVATPAEPTASEFLGSVIRSLATSNRGIKMVNDASAAKSSTAD